MLTASSLKNSDSLQMRSFMTKNSLALGPTRTFSGAENLSLFAWSVVAEAESERGEVKPYIESLTFLTGGPK